MGCNMKKPVVHQRFSWRQPTIQLLLQIVQFFVQDILNSMYFCQYTIIVLYVVSKSAQVSVDDCDISCLFSVLLLTTYDLHSSCPACELVCICVCTFDNQLMLSMISFKVTSVFRCLHSCTLLKQLRDSIYHKFQTHTAFKMRSIGCIYTKWFK